MGASPPLERFMRHVEKTSDSHWMWTGSRGGPAPHQYGYFRPGTRQTDPKVVAHRWLWEQTRGPIADGLELDHVCKTKLCVNPAHLEPVTMLINRERMRLRTCRSGRHDLTIAANVRWDRHGRRRGCHICWTESQQRRGTKPWPDVIAGAARRFTKSSTPTDPPPATCPSPKRAPRQARPAGRISQFNGDPLIGGYSIE